MKDKEQIRQGLKGSPKVKKFLDWMIMNQRDARPEDAGRKFIGAFGWTPHPIGISRWDGRASWSRTAASITLWAT